MRKTCRANPRVVAKTHGCVNTFPEDRSGEEASSPRDVDVRRHFMKTGWAKTHVVAKMRGRAKTLPEGTSGEDSRNLEGKLVLQCMDVLPVAASCVPVLFTVVLSRSKIAVMHRRASPRGT